ncbi:MAG: hypothetical protein IJO29_08600 [Oscillospiraceae bacterium]|nr:hypothetical protein [Oscillospiraceae bacterium]
MITIKDVHKIYNPKKANEFEALKGVSLEIADGELSCADAVMLKKWLLRSGSLTNPSVADLNSDNVINVSDLCILNRKLL